MSAPDTSSPSRGVSIEVLAATESVQVVANDTIDQLAAFDAPGAKVQRGEPSKEEVMAENEQLKSLLAFVVASMVDGAEVTALPKTPSGNVVVKAHTTPRKRRASRVGDLSSSQAKRVRLSSPILSPPIQGPIEAQCSPGATRNQQFNAARELTVAAPAGDSAIHTEGIMQFGNGTFTSALVPPIESVWSSPAAQMITPPASESPIKKKPARKSRAKKAEKPQQASPQLQQPVGRKFPVERPIAVLHAAKFNSLSTEEKCRLLLPLFRGADPTFTPRPQYTPVAPTPTPTPLAPAIGFDTNTHKEDALEDIAFSYDDANTTTPTTTPEAQEKSEEVWIGSFKSRIRAETARISLEPISHPHNPSFDPIEVPSSTAFESDADATHTTYTPVQSLPSFNYLPEPDMGATRQREALAKAARLQAEGRRR